MTCLTALTRVLVFASKYHANQRRKSDGSPYINHLIEVVDLLTTVADVNDHDELCAAVLHDSLEDTAIAESMIEEAFGSKVLDLVKALTDDKDLSLEQRREYTLAKLQTAQNSVKRIKLADIASNAAAIPTGWAEKRLADYFAWLDGVAELCRSASEALYQEYVTRRNLSLK